MEPGAAQQTVAQEHYDKQRESRAGLDDQQRAAILALAKDFHACGTIPIRLTGSASEMARLLIADVTLLKEADLQGTSTLPAVVRRTLHLPLLKPAWMLRQTPGTVVAEIDRLLEDHTIVKSRTGSTTKA
ncbi:MAG: hypothetical protein IPN78_19180 [Candidatus Accumulibacter sp.]|nr:hypothetical protein [Candidatus Accumulibacter propinquus]